MNEMNNNQTMDPGGQRPQSTPMEGAAPQNMKIDDKAIKKMAGEAITKVEGVLGLDGGLTGMLKSDDDMTKGLSVTLGDDGKTAQVSAKVITEYGKNIPGIVANVQGTVAETLHAMAGLTVDKVEVEVTDTMTAQDYQAKNSKGRQLS